MTTTDTSQKQDTARLCQDNPVAAIHTAIGFEAAAAMAAHTPPHIRAGIARYLILGIPPGSFLRAVFQNDLIGAAKAADADNAAALVSITRWVIAYAPDGSTGSAKAIEAWTARGGIGGAA